MPWQECKPMDECLRFVAISQYECTKSVKPGDLNPVIDPQGYLEHIDAQEHRFQTMLETNAPPHANLYSPPANAFMLRLDKH